ncbi:hypothetical protein LI012_12315 [Caldibacillus thermoamylovorans]|uniref:hypothetical protein n=1 Tax=Bacillaceae TaxID=186817 RepID=UPI001D0683DB|nr:hypothetical protein [Caldibacillus thermoamylovorans]MCB5935613.1 hypothetical protein [Bacillus sp. DFI.2.34]MCB7077596.1 hypothetical protein [Caldibacillus thermoamylovorans]
MNDIVVQPITCFEWKGAFIVTLFPSITKGIVTVLCGQKKGENKILVVHECLLCKAYGYENCPYIKEGMKTYMLHVQKTFPSYEVLSRTVKFNPNWKQIPIPVGSVEQIKGEKDDSRTELATQHH